MSYFDLSPTNQNQMLDEAAHGKRHHAAFFDDMVGAVGRGLYSGLVAKPDQFLWAGLDKVVTPLARSVNESFGLNDSSGAFIQQQRHLAEQQVRRLAPDPASTGTAGQVLFSLFDTGAQALAGSLLGGAAGAASAVGVVQGVSEFEKLKAEGVDATTAQEKALVEGSAAGLGALLPASLGLRAGGMLAEGVAAQLSHASKNALLKGGLSAVAAVPDIFYAAGSNITTGMTQRALSAEILHRGGYPEMAAQYDLLNQQALLSDAVLGVAFGGLGHVFHAGKDYTDAGLTVRSALHAEGATAPGIPVNVLSRNAHASALQKAMYDLTASEPVDVAELVSSAEFLPLLGRRKLIAQVIQDAFPDTAKTPSGNKPVVDHAMLSFYTTPHILSDAGTNRPGEKAEKAHTEADFRDAEDALRRNPGMEIITEDDEGNALSRPAADVLAEAHAETGQAVHDAGLFDVAVSCFLRR